MVMSAICHKIEKDGVRIIFVLKKNIYSLVPFFCLGKQTFEKGEKIKFLCCGVWL